MQGNVDGTDELDIEYAGWGGQSTVDFTTWPGVSEVYYTLSIAGCMALLGVAV